MTELKKQAGQIIEFITLLEKVSGRITVPFGRQLKKPFVPSLKSKSPAPPLPLKEESVKTKM